MNQSINHPNVYTCQSGASVDGSRWDVSPIRKGHTTPEMNPSEETTPLYSQMSKQTVAVAVAYPIKTPFWRKGV